MNEDTVTIVLPRGLRAAVPSRADSLTRQASATSTGATSSAFDPRSMHATLEGHARLKNGIAFWARLNALICLSMTVLETPKLSRRRIEP